MVAFIQKAHGCIYFYNAIEAQEAQLAISDSAASPPPLRCRAYATAAAATLPAAVALTAASPVTASLPPSPRRSPLLRCRANATAANIFCPPISLVVAHPPLTRWLVLRARGPGRAKTAAALTPPPRCPPPLR